MTPTEIQSDLGYVRNLVKRSERHPTPVSILLLWAVIVLAGFASIDFFPRYTGLYWMILGPLGGIASGLLGWRHGLKLGQLDHAVGVRHVLHWSGMLVLIGLAVVLGATGHIPHYEMSRVILLIVSLGWWTAGVHFDRVFLGFGALMALGFVGTLVLSAYAWTILGAAMALGLLILALRRGRTDDIQTR
jgi:hypothetical protein